MYSKFLERCVVRVDTPLYEVFWKYHRNDALLCVLDSEEHFVGVIDRREIMNLMSLTETQMKTGGGQSICNQNCLWLRAGKNVYREAQAIFADNYVEFLPVVDDEGNLLDIMTRSRAFYRERFATYNLPRMWYAKGIDDAVQLAKLTGVNHISVLEFGVASGAGLINMEFHAQEQERLSGIKIDVYGFDSGVGLIFDEEDSRNIAWRFGMGDYATEEQELVPLLRKAKMIYGDICETAQEFINSGNHAPIGFVSIDVDNYTPAAAILNMLGNPNDKHFLPRVRLYFDDLASDMEFQGEALAVKEFNDNYQDMKISPEGFSVEVPSALYKASICGVGEGRVSLNESNYRNAYFMRKMKMLHRFQHPHYNKRDTIMYDLRLKSNLI